jgi:hypothetical protein
VEVRESNLVVQRSRVLSQKASEDRKWLGLDFVRSLLQEEAKVMEPSLHPFLSTSESPSEHVQTILHLASIVDALRAHLLTVISSSESGEIRQTRARQAHAELQKLAAALRFAENEASQALQRIEKLCSDIYKASM